MDFGEQIRMAQSCHSTLKLVLILLTLALQSSCQIFRDIALLYLNLDKDQDYLLSPEEQSSFTQDKENSKFHNL